MKIPGLWHSVFGIISSAVRRPTSGISRCANRFFASMAIPCRFAEFADKCLAN